MKISVITAVYNSAATIMQAIKSVAAQTYPNLEHIIIEGCSSDDSLSAIKQASHSRMKIYSEPDNGIYDALNKGIERATGDIIGFMHSDDFFAHNQVLTIIAAVFEDPSVDAVYGDLDYVSQTDTTKVVRQWSTGPFHKNRLKYGWMPAHPTLYLRRQVYDRLGLYDNRLGISADYDFILRYFSQEQVYAVYIPQVLYKMRLGGVSNGNWSKVWQKMEEDYFVIRRNHVGGLSTLALKNLSKVGQFFVRQGLTFPP